MQKSYVICFCSVFWFSLLCQSQQQNAYHSSPLLVVDSNHCSYMRSSNRFLRTFTEDGELINADVDSHLVVLSKKKWMVDMDTLLNSDEFLRAWRLSSREQRFYPLGLKRGVIKPPRIVSICTQDKTLQMVYKGSFIHEITQADVNAAPAARIAEMKLSVGSRVIRSRNLFVWLDLETLKLLRTATVEKPDGFWPDQMSPAAFVHQNEIFLTIQPDVQRDSLINDSIFAAKNFMLGKFELHDSVFTFSSTLSFLRPAWYTKLLNVNEYSNGMFQTIGSSLYYYLLSYPYVVELTTGKEFKVPEAVLQDVAVKFAMHAEPPVPVISVIGLIKTSKTIRLVARVWGTDTILCFKFSLKGKFLELTKLSDKKGKWYVDGKHLYHEQVGEASYVRLQKLSFVEE